MSKPARTHRSSGSTWLCATCGRRFARANQAHSCLRQSVDSHFEGKSPKVRQLFDRLVAPLGAAGSLRLAAVKSSINLASGSTFGSIKVLKDGLRVEFIATAPIEDARIVHRLVLSQHRVAHTLIVKSPADLTPSVRRWLRNAQRLQA